MPSFRFGVGTWVCRQLSSCPSVVAAHSPPPNTGQGFCSQSALLPHCPESAPPPSSGPSLASPCAGPSLRSELSGPRVAPSGRGRASAYPRPTSRLPGVNEACFLQQSAGGRLSPVFEVSLPLSWETERSVSLCFVFPLAFSFLSIFTPFLC